MGALDKPGFVKEDLTTVEAEDTESAIRKWLELHPKYTIDRLRKGRTRWTWFGWNIYCEEVETEDTF